MGWQDDPVSTQTTSWQNDPVVAPADTSRAERLGGIGMRGVMTGIGDLADLPMNLISLGDRAGAALRNKTRALFGLKPDATPMQPQPSASNAMTAVSEGLGLPAPQTPGENLLYSASRGATNALGFGAASGVSAPNLIRYGVSGATGGTASEYAKQQGVGPVGQVVAGLAGGLAPSLGETLARTGYRATVNALRPLTARGQESMAAQTLQQQATNPEAAASNLETAQPVVPGSPRTMGEASKDPGLLNLEKGIRGRSAADFAAVRSQQNTAQQRALQGMAGTEADVSAAQAARDTQTGAMRESALNSGGQADIAPVIEHIDSTLAGPIGKRDVASQALNWLKGKLTDAQGNPETDPARLYAVRQDINDAIAGKLGGDQAKFRLAQGQLIQARGVLDNAIEAAAPGFKAYLQRYSDLSKPIDQMQAMQEIERRANLTAADVTTGQQFLGSANFSRALDNAIQEGDLTPAQIEQLKAIRTDLQYGQAINGPLVKAPGSDTFQNLSIAQVIGAGPNPANAAMRVLTKPLAWIYGAAGSDARINEVLTQAALDPKFAAALLRRATPQTTYQLSAALRRMYEGAATGGATALPGRLSPSSDTQTNSAGTP